jgi:hypothetical protein
MKPHINAWADADKEVKHLIDEIIVKIEQN